MLNSSKGPAVKALRAQADKITYPKNMQETLNKEENLEILESLVEDLLVENNKMYHYESQFEESLVVKFINEEKNVEDGEEIPPAVSFKRKFGIAVEELTETIQGYLNKYLGTKTWSNKMTYILLIMCFIGVIYIESSIINKCKNLCKFNKKVKEEDKKETISKIKNEKNEQKNKKE